MASSLALTACLAFPSTVFLSMFNNLHSEIEVKLAEYAALLSNNDSAQRLQVMLQKMQRRLELNIQNIPHSLAAKTDAKQFELTIDSLLSKVNRQMAVFHDALAAVAASKEMLVPLTPSQEPRIVQLARAAQRSVGALINRSRSSRRRGS